MIRDEKSSCSEADLHLPKAPSPPSLSTLGAWYCSTCLVEVGCQISVLLVAVESAERQRASTNQGPAQIRAKSTEQKSSLTFITVYLHFDERVESFKEKRSVLMTLKCSGSSFQCAERYYIMPPIIILTRGREKSY